ncbi:hypothetical protein [Streptomyces albidoflavus]|uniref:hypothetical protein n=1 Tax=Streptomyces albidoflavus TaxID=1886 RepID=UPI0033BCA3E2
MVAKRNEGPGHRSAFDQGETAASWRAYRRRAWVWLGVGCGLAGGGLALVALGSVAPFLEDLAMYPLVLGVTAVVVALGALAIASAMRRTLRSGTWTACLASAPPPGLWSPRLVLRTPGGMREWVVVAVCVQQRFPLAVPPPSGVMWWCGDPDRGGVVAHPDAPALLWVRAVRLPGLARRDLRRAAAAGRPGRGVSAQPKGSPPAPLGVVTRVRGRAVFRWGAAVCALVFAFGAFALGEVGEGKRVDLTVIGEDTDGGCTVRWEDPWTGGKHVGPFRCDQDRDPLLGLWDSGFVVSSGPHRGELYSADEGAPGRARADALMVAGVVGGAACLLLGCVRRYQLAV